MIEIKERNNKLIEQLLDVWEKSVKETHLFLSNEEIKNIKQYVPFALKSVPNLIIETDENNLPVAFMRIDNEKLEMLFVSRSKRGKGIGKTLLEYGFKKYNVKEVVVNEQNPSAKAFYENLGFKAYKRSEVDEQGNPYPTLFMKIK